MEELDGLLIANNSHRVRSRDMFMLMALWMEWYPSPITKTLYAVRPTGCVLVDQRDRVIGLQYTGESHSIVRAILNCPVDPRGFDIYVSRFPCSMCTKMMVQAGINKVYYFPAKDFEMDWNAYCTKQCQDNQLDEGLQRRRLEDLIKEKYELNINSVSRLVSNNPIAMSRFIPTWCDQYSEGILEDEGSGLELLWELDNSIAQLPPFVKQFAGLSIKFRKTIRAISYLKSRYLKTPRSIGTDEILENPAVYQHAIVLAHIAAKRTDDPKVGVGAVLVHSDGSYGSVGWNGYPKNADVLDYPQDGADDLVDQDALKYDYILHAEQNALLWRMRPARNLMDAVMVTTKMPCDECSPVMYDCGVRRVVANVQVPKSIDDPSRLRGLTYDKINKLIKHIWVF
ncbi:cytidine deaminase-like protein [Globomyces pollinis-pini]|nr:cytidine deaminase-like protein [Globomyces pollinis-pini]